MEFVLPFSSHLHYFDNPQEKGPNPGFGPTRLALPALGNIFAVFIFIENFSRRTIHEENRSVHESQVHPYDILQVFTLGTIRLTGYRHLCESSHGFTPRRYRFPKFSFSFSKFRAFITEFTMYSFYSSAYPFPALSLLYYRNRALLIENNVTKSGQCSLATELYEYTSHETLRNSCLHACCPLQPGKTNCNKQWSTLAVQAVDTLPSNPQFTVTPPCKSYTICSIMVHATSQENFQLMWMTKPAI